MTDSLHAAASLADKLGGNIDALLPESPPVIDFDNMAAHRMELRQVAGVSAGGSLELEPGCYDFGPVRNGPGRLDGGQPDTVGFVLRLDQSLAASIRPGDSPVMLDDEPIGDETELAGRVINAGTARFVVARPRPPHRRDGAAREMDVSRLDPWVLAPFPVSARLAGDARVRIEQRRRLHYGPDEVRYRVGAGRPLLWDRAPSHPMFGTAVVAVADVPISAPGQQIHRSEAAELSVESPGLNVAAAVPVSIDLLSSNTMIFGERSLQLAVARHILLSLAAATHPRDLQIGLLSDRGDLNFLRRLPHAERATVDGARPGEGDEPGDGPVRKLMVVDGPGSAGTTFAPNDETTSVLALARDGDQPHPGSDVVMVWDQANIGVACGNGGPALDGATPVGFAQSMAVDLVEKLRGLPDLDPPDA
jgi:hypothetical protein